MVFLGAEDVMVLGMMAFATFEAFDCVLGHRAAVGDVA